jgi:hypothetical protein
VDLHPLAVGDREHEIVKFLKRLDQPERGATVPEIWRAVSSVTGDDVTRQAYYKLVDRLVAVGTLEEMPVGGDGDARRYRLVPYLTAENAVTLDDVYELLDQLAPSEAIARIVDAREYYQDRRRSTLRLAAEALLEEDPRDLVVRYIESRAAELAADLAMHDEPGLRDRELEKRIDTQARDLRSFAYRYLGLSREAIDISSFPNQPPTVSVRPGQLRAEVEMRVFGAHCIEAVTVRDEPGDESFTVSGSDGSTHASVMQVATARAFEADVGNQVVTFNNSVARVKAPRSIEDRYPVPYYSVPAARSALDDPGNRGMVLAPFMFRYLNESEYEHMAKAATDVVQWRTDREVFLGTARALGRGELLPRPRVHIRDGTIALQEREFGHYCRLDEYGQMVREGFALTRKILERIVAAPDSPPVFAGATKVTVTRFFSSLINWYISKGSRLRPDGPIDPNWDATRAAHIADNEAMSYLLSSLVEGPQGDRYYVSFAVMRPFHTLTEFYDRPDRDSFDWVAGFRLRQERDREDLAREGTSGRAYLATVADVADDDFVYLCGRADYVAFYIGHTAAEPPPIAPRYEFLENLRAMPTAADAAARVQRNVGLIVRAIHRTGLTEDREHNFLSKKSIVRIIPFVVFDAHEKCKAMGRKVEAELRSAVISNLQVIRNARGLRAGDVQFLPLPIRRFIERYERARRDSGASDGSER